MADLLVVVLRVPPGEIREWLRAGRNLPGKRREGPDASDLARENREAKGARYPAGKGHVTLHWKGGEGSGGPRGLIPRKGETTRIEAVS